MKQSLQLKVSQQLTLTPQLQQSIRLLRLSTLWICRNENIPHDNPMLERDEGQPDPLPGASETPSNSDVPSEAAPEAQEASRDDDGPADSPGCRIGPAAARATTTMTSTRTPIWWAEKPCANICWINWVEHRAAAARPRGGDLPD